MNTNHFPLVYYSLIVTYIRRRKYICLIIPNVKREKCVVCLYLYTYAFYIIIIILYILPNN